jgi:hypothetical protein
MCEELTATDIVENKMQLGVRLEGVVQMNKKRRLG